MCQGGKKTRGVDLKLLTAVSLSARFPWISPAGWLERSSDQAAECESAGIGDRLYLVDGGYFENSGFETAIELHQRLRSYALANNRISNL
jgi:hypothetical protein